LPAAKTTLPPAMMQPELLSPAGTLTHLRYAFAYGADAVYAGQPRYSLRVRNNSFRDVAALAEGIDEARRQGKRFYLASNIAAHNDKVRSYLRDLEPVIELKPDALIMSDPGLIMLVRERWPEQEVHLSVQANAVNWAAVEFWRRQGIRRVILSRELSLEEVAEIREKVPAMELEVFVHGALCIVHGLLRSLPAVRLHEPSRCQPGCRLQRRPLGLQGRCPYHRRGWRNGAGAQADSGTERIRRAAIRPVRRARTAAGRSEASWRICAGIRRRARHLHHELARPACGAACRRADPHGRALAEDRGPHQEPLLCGAHRAGLPSRH